MNLITFALICSCMVKGSFSKLSDWLINDFKEHTTLSKTEDGNLVLGNGLISREFSIHPDFTTVDYFNHEKQASILRALSPEAVIGLDDVVYEVGSIATNITRAYMNRTALKADFHLIPHAFHFDGYQIKKIEAPFPYKPMRGAPKDIVWPPDGLRLDVDFRLNAPDSASALHKDITVTIHYEMYDGIPAISKWVSISAIPSAWGKIKVAVYSVELLAVNQQWAQVSSSYNTYKWMFVGTDQAHGTDVHWINDASASLAPGSFEPVVNVSYAASKAPTPSEIIGSDGYETFRVHELPHGASDDTRRALARHRLFRLLAPHTQENPIFFHMTKSDSKSFRAVVDQLQEVGFEMVIYSFGSGFNLETTNETYIEAIKADIDYAKSKGIEVGGYDLIVLDRYSIDFKHAAITKDNETTGNACMASAWYEYIHTKIMTFIDKTGLSMIETDGPYGGGSCASTLHPHHQGYDDSVYQQEKLQGKLYMELRKRNIFINQPDNFFYQGGSKTGLGYNEDQYSLPRWEDLSISRQDVYDRVYHLIPTAGWMFLPLVDYHGGGAAAEFEPLAEHLTEYKIGLAQYLGAGVAACYRGYRVYDTDETKNLVIHWVKFYKKYRDTLISDIVQVRRPSMQSIDSYMHVNYKLLNKGLAMVFNPTLERQQMNLTLPLYYTGIENIAAISQEENGFDFYQLSKGWEVEVYVDLQPQDVTWFLIQDGEEANY